MSGTELHWVDGPWKGRLALAARPRGGDWLCDEMEEWRRNGVDTILSLLEAYEERELDLNDERKEAVAHGLYFRSFPIPDRQIPASNRDLIKTLEQVEVELVSGRNVVLHCRQGVGRTGLVAASLLMLQGLEAEAAIRMLSEARGIEMPETVEQRKWLDAFADSFAATR